MMDNRSNRSDECQEFRQYLQGAWADGHLDEITNLTDVATTPRDETTSRLGEHMMHCLECEQEAQSTRTLHALLESDLRSIGRSVTSPSADQIAEILRRSEEPPESTTLRRIRRPVKTILWFTFYALCLLAGLGLIALAIQARSGH